MTRSNFTTEKLFRNAGVSEGMSVLELGCGSGEVSKVLSEIVGPSGSVLAVDRSADGVLSAKSNLESAAIGNVQFACADLDHAPTYLEDIAHNSFDVIAGRRVLMYLSHPEKVLANLLPWLKPEGSVVFEEADSTLCPGNVELMPAHVEGTVLLGKLLDKEGVNKSMGFNLPSMFSAAGLLPERIWAEAVIDGQDDEYTLGELLLLLQSRMKSEGVATSLEIDSLAKQINREKRSSAIFISSMRFCGKAIKSSVLANGA